MPEFTRAELRDEGDRFAGSPEQQTMIADFISDLPKEKSEPIAKRAPEEVQEASGATSCSAHSFINWKEL